MHVRDASFQSLFLTGMHFLKQVTTGVCGMKGESTNESWLTAIITNGE